MKIYKSILNVSAIIALTFLFSCNTEKAKSNKAVIKGSFTEFEGLKAVVKSTSPYQLEADTLTTDANGNFVFNTKIQKPTYYTVSFVGRRPTLIVYVRPGDSVLINANSVGDIMKTVRFGGNAPIYNDYIFRSENINNIFNQSLMSILGQEEKAALSSLDSVRAIHADEIAALQKGNANIDPVFIKTEVARSLYQWAILHQLYPDYYAYIHKLENKDAHVLSPEFDTYLAEVNLNDEELINLPIYIDFVQTYLRADFNKFYEDSLSNEYSSYADFQLKTIDKKIENKNIKAILAYKSISDQVMYQGNKDKDSYWETFNSLCTDDNLKNDISVKLASWSHLNRGSTIEEIAMQDTLGNQIHFSDFVGKWIYVDVWATWCSPCRKEIPVLKELEEEFKGQDVVFMSISVDRSPEPWKKMVKAEELKGVQVWAGQNQVINNFYKVSGIPRFMIFDPQGKIYEANADRPSMGAGKIIKGLLKK